MEVVEAAKCFFGFSILLWKYTQADPANLIQNGDFNVEGFVFNQYPIMDVISTGQAFPIKLGNFQLKWHKLVLDDFNELCICSYQRKSCLCNWKLSKLIEIGNIHLN